MLLLKATKCGTRFCELGTLHSRRREKYIKPHRFPASGNFQKFLISRVRIEFQLKSPRVTSIISPVARVACRAHTLKTYALDLLRTERAQSILTSNSFNPSRENQPPTGTIQLRKLCGKFLSENENTAAEIFLSKLTLFYRRKDASHHPSGCFAVRFAQWIPPSCPA